MAPRLYTSSVAKVTMMEKKTNARLVTIAVVVSVEGGATTGDAVDYAVFGEEPSWQVMPVMSATFFDIVCGD